MKRLRFMVPLFIPIFMVACQKEIPEPEIKSISFSSYEAVPATAKESALGDPFFISHQVKGNDVYVECRVKGVSFRNDLATIILTVDGKRMDEINHPAFIIKGLQKGSHQTRMKDNRPIGKILGDAVMSSVQTLLMIGGFIILFSVVNKLLFHLQITSFFAKAIEVVLTTFQLPIELSIPLISGLFEITLGAQLISKIQDATLMDQAIITSLILGFSGFSVQAQVASILAQTDIRFKPFFFARIIHGIFSAAYTFFLWKPIYEQSLRTENPFGSVPVSFIKEDTALANFLSSFSDIGAIVTIGILIVYTFLYAKRNVIFKRN